MKKILALVLSIAMLLALAGCQTKQPIQDIAPEEYKEIGKGETSFLFSVTDKENKTEGFRVYTDKKIVGDALQELDMIDGEEGPYGMYVKTVNGITVDFDKDKLYWAFYIEGEYATSGVDKTEIENGKSYAFKVSK